MSKFSKTTTAKVWQHAPSKYRGTALVVLLKLAGLTNDEGHAHPSTCYLAKACGVDPRHIQRITQRLKKDGVLKIQRGKGVNKYRIQVEAIAALPLAVPPDYKNEDSQPEEAAQPTQQPLDAQWLAKNFHAAIERDLPDAVIPADWQTTWSRELQTLFDAGHDYETLARIARFAIDHSGWANMEIGPHGAHGFVKHFAVIHQQFEKTQKERAA